MQTKILVLAIAGCFFWAGYYTRVVIVDNRHDALSRMLEQAEAQQKKTYADMDRALRTEPVQDSSDYVKFQRTKQH